MKILLPMDSDDTQEGQLVAINDAKTWALIDLEAGQVVEVSYFDTKEDVNEWLDAVVVVGDYEPVMEFIEQQTMVLVAHTQRYIDDIVEAFLFKELHDLAV
jgi:predicted Fe-Mo cluster-binding NifX family protein